MLLTKYIKPEEFEEYTGIDLVNELPDQDANRFLNRIEVRMSAFLNARYFQNVDRKYPEFSEYQKEQYKYALMEQALYVFKNGDTSVDSGYDPESGVIASRSTLINLSLSPNAEAHLMNCGLLTRKIGGSQKFRNGFFW